MKKLIFMLVAMLIVLAGCSNSDESTLTSTTSEEKSETNVVRIGWGNAGFPSPFTFSNSGPGGFLRNTFLFDTLTWKDDTGVIPWLASSWEISKDN